MVDILRFVIENVEELYSTLVFIARESDRATEDYQDYLYEYFRYDYQPEGMLEFLPDIYSYGVYDLICDMIGELE